MVTPLTSIIGSGVLVVAPLLASVAGSFALASMLLIVVLAYAIELCPKVGDAVIVIFALPAE